MWHTCSLTATQELGLAMQGLYQSLEVSGLHLPRSMVPTTWAETPISSMRVPSQKPARNGFVRRFSTTATSQCPRRCRGIRVEDAGELGCASRSLRLVLLSHLE